MNITVYPEGHFLVLLALRQEETWIFPSLAIVHLKVGGQQHNAQLAEDEITTNSY